MPTRWTAEMDQLRPPTNQRPQAASSKTSLTARSSTSTLAPLGRDIDVEISLALNGIIESAGDGQVIMYEDRRPSLAVIEQFKRRLLDLTSRTVAENHGDIARALEKAFAAMPSQSSNPKLQAMVYMEELADLDAATVISVINRFVRGEIPSQSDFVPTIAKIRQHAGESMRVHAKERARIEKVLSFWDVGRVADKKITWVPARLVE